ncbi:uncharacterized protein LOC133850870 [Drosophila sulfurigaster albostrigata]|uniref:uncharacterized protein LOC133850870 n=1 Tax=Drosophila sulfurigaster albostrigata TaxID=89887 RepID=UPI002D21D4B0|nr:uncharacterized protein LOC133850870 [Drosophila sulfurigaster albostrigata]
MFRRLVIVLWLNFAFVASRIFVPTIRILNTPKEGFQLTPNPGGYQLQIIRKDDYVDELVREIEPGELQIQGIYEQKYDNNVTLLVNYIVDYTGYGAYWEIRNKENNFHVIDFASHSKDIDHYDEDGNPILDTTISATCLKCLTG